MDAKSGGRRRRKWRFDRRGGAVAAGGRRGGRRRVLSLAASPLISVPSSFLCFSLLLSFPWCSSRQLSRPARRCLCCCGGGGNSKDRRRASERKKPTTEAMPTTHSRPSGEKENSKIRNQIFTSAPRQRCETNRVASCRAGRPAGRRGPRGGRATTFYVCLFFFLGEEAKCSLLTR